ncbi:MAG: hypothetical protein IPL61_14050 [Myxococcales bacterium]|nr:hypothetical protein [Myxococcales bacterium]
MAKADAAPDDAAALTAAAAAEKFRGAVAARTPALRSGASDREPSQTPIRAVARRRAGA